MPPPGQPSPSSPAPPSGDNRAPSIDGLGSLPNNSTASVAFTPADPDGDGDHQRRQKRQPGEDRDGGDDPGFVAFAVAASKAGGAIKVVVTP